MTELAVLKSPEPTRNGADPVRLGAYLRSHIDGLRGDPVIRAAEGGLSNPTYFLDFPDQSLVLRRKPDVRLSPSAHRIDREYRFLEALAPTAVPVPTPLLFVDDESVIGAPFYIMERLWGTVHDSYALPGVTTSIRPRCFESVARTLANLHSIDWRASGLAEFERPGDYFERQLNGWAKQWSNFNRRDLGEIDDLLVWLRSNIPPLDGIATIVHGDYRFANIMLAGDGSVSGVFDWELATIGHPLADLGFCLQGWLLPPEQNGGIAGLDIASLGIPSARSFLDVYYKAAPDMPPLQAFHIAFAMFRAAVGLSSVAERADARGDESGGVRARSLAQGYARAGVFATEHWA